MPKFMNKQVVYLLIATKEINSSKLQAELSAKFTETNFKDYNYQESFKYDNTLIIAVGHLHEGSLNLYESVDSKSKGYERTNLIGGTSSNIVFVVTPEKPNNTSVEPRWIHVCDFQNFNIESIVKKLDDAAVKNSTNVHNKRHEELKTGHIVLK